MAITYKRSRTGETFAAGTRVVYENVDHHPVYFAGSKAPAHGTIVEFIRGSRSWILVKVKFDAADPVYKPVKVPLHHLITEEQWLADHSASIEHRPPIIFPEDTYGV
jgi:hypothetical protein